MKKLFSCLCFLILLIGCEDKEKTGENPNPAPITVIDSTTRSKAKKELRTKVLDKQDKDYPLLTNDNVEAFLTDYGKENSETKVKIETSEGAIEIELYKDTPLHRANFVYLIKQNYFKDAVFHRIVPDFIIQAGNSDLSITQKKRAQLGKDYLLPSEINSNRKHSYGTVSGAKEYRENPDNRSAPYEFFIFLGPDESANHLNGTYTIFGKVTQGMDVVERISQLERDSEEWPLKNVYLHVSLVDN